MPLSNAQARDVQSLLHPYTNLVKLRETGPVVFERGKGVRVYDEHGKDYIEAMAGLWCTALGWLAWDGKRWTSYDAGLGKFDSTHIVLALGDGSPDMVPAAFAKLHDLQIVSAEGVLPALPTGP